jgi:DNA-binding Lrp family transcriptional regulator
MRQLSTLDAEILDIVQRGVPLAAHPFAMIAQSVGASEREIIERLGDLKDKDHVIRQISAIFDTKALGYRSALVAARYDDERIDASAAVVGRHPGVSHNYRRDHTFNLWYTLAVPPNSRLGLDRTIERLHEISRAISTRKMQTLRVFKIGVQLDVKGDRAADSQVASDNYDEEDQAEARSYDLSETDIRAIRALQRDLPLASAPFDPLAAEAGTTVEDLLAAATRFLERKQMRRFAAVLHHREAGFAANCMGVWNVPDDRVEDVGRTMAAFAAVSHCYLRPRFDDWPFNLFTMVHGKTQEDCLCALDAIAKATGIRDRGALWSTKEYKKVRVSYFTPEIDEWEARYGEGDIRTAG